MCGKDVLCYCVDTQDGCGLPAAAATAKLFTLPMFCFWGQLEMTVQEIATTKHQIISTCPPKPNHPRLPTHTHTQPPPPHLHHQRHVGKVQPACNHVARKHHRSRAAPKRCGRVVARLLAQPAVQVVALTARGARQGGVELSGTCGREEHDHLQGGCWGVDGGG